MTGEANEARAQLAFACSDASAAEAIRNDISSQLLAAKEAALLQVRI